MFGFQGGPKKRRINFRDPWQVIGSFTGEGGLSSANEKMEELTTENNCNPLGHGKRDSPFTFCSQTGTDRIVHAYECPLKL